MKIEYRVNGSVDFHAPHHKNINGSRVRRKMVTYTSKDLQEILHLGKRQADALLRTKTFPSIKIGRNWIVEEEAFKTWLSNTKEIKLDYSNL